MARRRVEGVGNYVHQLALRLPVLAPEIEFLLLTDRPIDASRLPVGCRQVVVGLAFAEGGVRAKAYSPFWMNCVVPRVLAYEKVTLFHGTNYALPAVGHCRYVLTIHDIAFISVPSAFSLVHRSYLRSLVRMGVQRADHVVVGSEAARDDIAPMRGVEFNRLSVI
ncbi:MAG TPA: glycosyltransferase, partial [bacterium]|nr:glycosyltransferase [bacterium]